MKRRLCSEPSNAAFTHSDRKSLSNCPRKPNTRKSDAPRVVVVDASRVLERNSSVPLIPLRGRGKRRRGAPVFNVDNGHLYRNPLSPLYARVARSRRALVMYTGYLVLYVCAIRARRGKQTVSFRVAFHCVAALVGGLNYLQLIKATGGGPWFMSAVCFRHFCGRSTLHRSVSSVCVSRFSMSGSGGPKRNDSDKRSVSQPLKTENRSKMHGISHRGPGKTHIT